MVYDKCNAIQQEVIKIAGKSRADYMKKRREGKKTFSALIDEKKLKGLKGNSMQKIEAKLHGLKKRLTKKSATIK